MSKLLLFVRYLFDAWTWRMAWRDSRRSRSRLLLFSASIILGIAALAAIGSFGQQMEEAVEEQAKTLLGADLMISSRKPFLETENRFFQSLGGVQAREISFSSMIFFPKSGGTRLVQVRALAGDFPFYGALETTPVTAATEFRTHSSALVERNLLAQFGATVGDSVKIGEVTMSIAGSLEKVPGETVAFATIAPRVYMPLVDLEKTKLLGRGSLVRYKIYFQFGSGIDMPKLVEKLRPDLEKFGLGFDTVEERKQDLGRAMTNLYHFLNLVGFVALLLGGVGIASAIHVHIKQKLGTVAILRCLGSAAAQAFAIYFVQGLALGLVGAVLGGLLGLILQVSLPVVIADFLPFKLSFSISWIALLRGMSVGVLICLLFALLPLLSVRRVSPLAAFRSSYESGPRKKDPLLWLCYGFIAAGIMAFGISQSRRWIFGVWFAIALWAAFGILAGAAKACTRLMKGKVPKFWPYVWRQGLANLYRPNNRTVLLVISLGLGTFLILTLALVQKNLVQQLFPAERTSQGNTVLFDIQSDQKEEILKLLRSQRLPILEQSPIVTMRLLSIKGRSIEVIKAEAKRSKPNWALQREYRSTYRDHLVDTEKLISGEWHRRVKDENAPVPISMEEGIAKRLNVTLGDEIVFDVQGLSVKTTVASLREVDWRRLHPNFFVVFPSGIIEEAPSVHVLLTRIESNEQSAIIQREVVRRFPNVSIVDLTLVLQTVDSILTKISFVIRFMALFTVGTGLLVLVGAVLTGRYQRIQEGILLRTLGASRKQILQILAVEYLFLGIFASFTGILLALAASWALAFFVFKVSFSLSLLPIALAFVSVSSLTILTGLLTSRGIYNRPPLEILRAEA
ncbi:MAG: FtsX-like permease family protein [Pedosphaera sp.]|nr:FtsX-like permease family protein [Pedosphaera sp.]